MVMDLAGVVRRNGNWFGNGGWGGWWWVQGVWENVPLLYEWLLRRKLRATLKNWAWFTTLRHPRGSWLGSDIKFSRLRSWTSSNSVGMPVYRLYYSLFWDKPTIHVSMYRRGVLNCDYCTKKNLDLKKHIKVCSSLFHLLIFVRFTQQTYRCLFKWLNWKPSCEEW